jgi:hypothetical protein
MDFTQRQIMLSLAYVAYTDQLLLTGSPTLDTQIKADIESALSADAATPIPPVAGQWSVVWGPVTYTVPGALYQDNLMYVARLNQEPSDPGPTQYAIAVRGTNGTVLLDWLLEDFDILQTMPWPPGASGSDVVGQISESTNIGLTALLNMQDGETGQTLLQYLTQKIHHAGSKAVSVCCAGHSLGAALSSTLALYLRDNQSTWDPDSNAIVTTINFAGPSAGDADFAAYFDQQFSYTGTSPLSFWDSPTTSPNSYADCVRTSLDIAPLVWNATSMKNQIESIYTGQGIHDILAPLGTSEVIGWVVDATQVNAYTQIQAAQPTLAGTLVDRSDLPPGLSSCAWVAEAEDQHHCSYPQLLDVPSLLVVFPVTQGISVPADAAMAHGQRIHFQSGESESRPSAP